MIAITQALKKGANKMVYFALTSLLIALVMLTLGFMGVAKGAAGIVAVAFFLFLAFAATTALGPRIRGGLRRRRSGLAHL